MRKSKLALALLIMTYVFAIASAVLIFVFVELSTFDSILIAVFFIALTAALSYSLRHTK